MTITRFSVPAPMVAEQLRACEITHFVTMPDYVQIPLNDLVDAGGLPGVRVVNCATEDEAVAIAYGLHTGGAVPYLSMQNQGLFACANALRSIGRGARTPLPILAGQWGRELENLGKDPSESRSLEVSLVEPLLDALRIPHFRLDSPDAVEVVRKAFGAAHAGETATVVLVGAHMSWEA